MVPTEGYNTDQYSERSIKWLEWLNPSENLSIQHALNVGKRRLSNTHYKLDGYDPTTHTGYEFQGSLYHGCLFCYPDTKHLLKKKKLYTLTKMKETMLNSIQKVTTFYNWQSYVFSRSHFQWIGRLNIQSTADYLYSYDLSIEQIFFFHLMV